jgi:hypothetical protein
MRKLATALVALVGIVLMVIGIWGAQPMGGSIFLNSQATNPQILGGATFWIGGIVLLIASPAVYCLARD